MIPELKDQLAGHLLAMADDELILGLRDSEWCGFVPLFEEDIAFCEPGPGRDRPRHNLVRPFPNWWEKTQMLTRTPWYIAKRPSITETFRWLNCQKRDWSFSILGQYLFDAFEMINLEAMKSSQYRPLAEAAAKIRNEEIYHYKHTSAWVRRLGLRTNKSRRSLQRALEQLCLYTWQLYDPLPGESDLIAAGVIREPDSLAQSWIEKVIPYLEVCGLRIPAKGTTRNQGISLTPVESGVSSRRQHTPHFNVL